MGQFQSGVSSLSRTNNPSLKDYQWDTTIPVKGEKLSDANFVAGYGSIALQISIMVSVHLFRCAIMHPNCQIDRLTG